MDEMIVAIRNLLAPMVRKGKTIIIVAIVAALLLGGLEGFSQWKKLNNEEYRDLEQLTYEQDLLKLENDIKHVTRSITNQEEYLENSLWMQINPYDKHVVQVYLAISGVDEKDVDMTFGQDTTPLEYLMGKITTQYQILWSALDLQKDLGLPQYADIEEKYINELIGINFLGSGIISVSAIGNSEAEASELANALADILVQQHPTAAKNSYKHNISVYDIVHQNVVDNSMVAAQEAQHEQFIYYNDSIIATEKAIRKLEKPDSALVSIVKMVIIGGIVGGVLGCAWYCMKTLLRDSLQSSIQAEQALAVPYLGTTVESNKFFHTLANRVSAERVWKDEKQATSYISESAKVRMTGKQILLTSSLDLDQDDIKALKKALSGNGVEITFQSDFAHNPAALPALAKCDCVILAERADDTKLGNAVKICQLANEYSKPVAGFVLI